MMDSLPAPDFSSVENVAKAIVWPKVLKAFNKTYATTLLLEVVVGLPLDVFIASNEADAKNKVAELVNGGAIRIVDVGPLSCVRPIN